MVETLLFYTFRHLSNLIISMCVCVCGGGIWQQIVEAYFYDKRVKGYKQFYLILNQNTCEQYNGIHCCGVWARVCMYVLNTLYSHWFGGEFYCLPVINMVYTSFHTINFNKYRIFNSHKYYFIQQLWRLAGNAWIKSNQIGKTVLFCSTFKLFILFSH